MIIEVTSTSLTDGSIVYDVIVADEKTAKTATFSMATEEDALMLMDLLEHTVIEATVGRT